MYRYLLLVLLIVSAQQGGASSYFLSPALPPTAFLGQYYTTQFRVLGLDNPVFKFVGLPPCLKGSPDGTLEGTPDKAGSFVITVQYTAPGCDAANQVVIRVANSVASTTGVNSAAGVQANAQFIVVNVNSSLVYKAGQNINLNLGADHGKAPYTWSFSNLPSGLVGDKSGKISGALSQNGYYSFNAVANDCDGQSADAYYTLNVQPATLVPTSNLIEVPNRNVPVQYNLDQVLGQTVQAANAVYSAIKTVSKQQENYQEKREAQAKTTLALQLATTQENAAEDGVAKAKNANAAAQQAAAKAQVVLDAANKNVALATTNVNNAIKVVNAATDALAEAQTAFNVASQALKAANNKFVNAQAESGQAAQNAKAALTAALNAQNVYNLAFNSYSNAKKALSDAQDQLQQANTVVDAARNALTLATQVNDDAQAELTTAQNAYNQAYSALNNANNLVSGLTGKLNGAQNDLGVAKFNLQQANNNLFVAQARKQQADKATSIVRLQTSTLPAPGSNSTYIFAGCDQLAYPAISGTVVINAANSLGFSLASGQTLLFGDCTTKEESCTTGDVISYTGYIRDGYIHCTSYKKN